MSSPAAKQGKRRSWEVWHEIKEAGGRDRNPGSEWHLQIPGCGRGGSHPTPHLVLDHLGRLVTSGFSKLYPVWSREQGCPVVTGGDTVSRGRCAHSSKAPTNGISRSHSIKNHSTFHFTRSGKFSVQPWGVIACLSVIIRFAAFLLR